MIYLNRFPGDGLIQAIKDASKHPIARIMGVDHIEKGAMDSLNVTLKHKDYLSKKEVALFNKYIKTLITTHDAMRNLRIAFDLLWATIQKRVSVDGTQQMAIDELTASILVERDNKDLAEAVKIFECRECKKRFAPNDFFPPENVCLECAKLLGLIDSD